jgi:hypothetical protein
MSAHDYYMVVVGEIGVPPLRFREGLKWWEIRSIIRGYNRRHRDMWSSARWQTYNLMCAIPYCDLKKGGIYKPTDLIKFPWDEAKDILPTQDEMSEFMAEAEAINKQRRGNG